jgi:DNA repair protein RecO (recombination protein O)
LYFIILCSRELGYDLKGEYSLETPHLNLQEGGYSDKLPAVAPYATDEDARALDKLLKATDVTVAHETEMSSDMRMRLIDWYVAFLQRYTQHMSGIRSLPILRTILH